MKFAGTLVLALIVAALAAFTMYDSKRKEAAGEREAKVLEIFRLKPDEVTKIELIRRGSPPIELQRTNESWQLLSPLKDRADGQETRNLIRSAQSEKATEIVAEGSDVNLKTYGLDDPPTRVKFTTQTGAIEDVKIGSVKAYDSNLYAQINSDPCVYLVSSNWDEILTKPISTYRDKHLYLSDKHPDAPDVSRLTIRQSDPGLASEIAFTKGEKGEWAQALPREPVAKGLIDNAKINAYVEKIRDLQAQDFHADQKAGQLAKFGLEPAALDIELELKTKPPSIYKLDLSTPAPPRKKSGDAPANPLGEGDCYAVSSDLDPVVSIFKSAAEALFVLPDAFYDKKFPFTFDASQAASLRIVINGTTSEFRKSGVWTSIAKGEAVDSKAVDEFVTRLSQIEAVRVFSETSSDVKPSAMIAIADAQNRSLLKFEWGGERVEKARGSRPEARYTLARTEKVSLALGIPEKMATSFDPKTLFAKPAAPSPAPSATAPHN